MIKLSDDFSYSRLLRFAAPSIAMMIFTSIYNVTDGLFVANLVGKIPFAALTLIWPVLSIAAAVGFMIGAGGTAIIGRSLGKHHDKRASEYFSMFVWLLIGVGAVIGAVMFALMPTFARLLGASDELISECVIYGRTVIVALPFAMVQMCFSSFFIVAEKPKWGLLTTIISGLTNIILDALFIAVFGWGLFGAALATALGQGIGALIGLIYFARENSSLLRLSFDFKFRTPIIMKACTNGSSEMVSSVAYSLITMLYNYQLMRFIGTDGVVAYGVVMYAGFIFSAIFYGFCMGVEPIFSYNHGAKNFPQLQNVFKKSLSVILVAGSAMLCVVWAFGDELVGAFLSSDENARALATHALHIFAITYILSGCTIFASGFFTALNNGKISALISFMRSLVFETAAIILMPMIFGASAIWWAIVVAEIGAFSLSVYFLITQRKIYKYA